MTVEKIWKIERLETEYTDGVEKVVTCVHWACEGTDGSHNGRVFKMMILPAPSTDYVSYQNLTEDLVINWVHKLMGEDTVTYWEQIVDIQIEKQHQLTQVSLTLPWETRINQ